MVEVVHTQVVVMGLFLMFPSVWEAPRPLSPLYSLRCIFHSFLSGKDIVSVFMFYQRSCTDLRNMFVKLAPFDSETKTSLSHFV